MSWQGLAKAIAWDGEGATVLIEVTARGAGSNAEARTVAKSVVASSLVKAAIFGHDPNWGRIACAAGCAPDDPTPPLAHPCLHLQNGLKFSLSMPHRLLVDSWLLPVLQGRRMT